MAEQPKKQPMGPLIEWTDEDLDKMAEITELDIKNAVALWRNGIEPAALKPLLDADKPERRTASNGRT